MLSTTLYALVLFESPIPVTLADLFLGPLVAAGVLRTVETVAKPVFAPESDHNADLGQRKSQEKPCSFEQKDVPATDCFRASTYVDL